MGTIRSSHVSITEAHLCELSAKIQHRLDTLAANAAAAFAELDSLGIAACARITETEYHTLHSESRCAELSTDISQAVAHKTAALEAELVAVDDAITYLHDSSSHDGGTDTAQEFLLSKFGRLPLEPVELASLLIDTSSDGCGAGSVATVCAPRGLSVEDVGLSPQRLPTWVRAGASLCFEVLVVPSRLPSHETARREAAESLAARLRVDASLAPQDALVQGHQLALSCEVNRGGSGAVIRVAVPSLADLPHPGTAVTWVVRIDSVALGPSRLSMGDFQTSYTVADHGPVCPPGVLHRACGTSDLPLVRRILHSAAPDTFSTEETSTDSRRFSCLWLAVHYNDAVVCQLLLDAFANPNALNGDGDTPLHCSANRGHFDITEMLLRHPHVDVNAMAPGKGTALHCVINSFASLGARLKVLRLLLAHPAINVNLESPRGRSPLHTATLANEHVLVRALLEDLRVDVHCRDPDGRTPLEDAVQRGFSEIVEAFAKCPRVDVTMATPDGRTVLHMAAYHRRAEVVTALLTSACIDVNAVNAADHLTPLHVAANRGSDAVVSRLLSDPRVDINARGRNGVTPLIAASLRGHTSVVIALLTRPDVDVNAATVTGFSALHGAAYGGHFDVLECLLRSPHVRVNATLAETLFTPLHGAALYGRSSVVARLLADPRIDAKAVTANGSTALVLSRQQAKSAPSSSLLEARAKLDHASPD